MKYLIKVYRTAYLALSMNNLAIFIKDIIKNMDGNPVYAMMQDQVTILKAKSDDFNEALVDAQNGGKKQTTARKQAKIELIKANNVVSDLLDAHAEGVASFITDTGNKLQKAPTRKAKNNLPPKEPLSLSARSIGEVGSLKIEFILPEGGGEILMVAAEWSPDNSETWVNGRYFDKETGTLTDLPSFTEVLVRVRSIGKDDMKSDWTPSVKARVL